MLVLPSGRAECVSYLACVCHQEYCGLTWHHLLTSPGPTGYRMTSLLTSPLPRVMLSMRDPESLRWVNQVITNSIGKSLIDEPISLGKKKNVTISWRRVPIFDWVLRLTNSIGKKIFLYYHHVMEEPILIGREYILVYQPIVRRRRTSNVFWSTGLVKMSAQRRAEAIFVIL